MTRHHPHPKNAATATTAPDGYLPAALRRFDKAITALAGPQPQIIDTRLRYTDSRYEQLHRAVRGQQGRRFGGTNTIPLWTDALDLLTDITHTVRAWYQHGRTDDDPPTAPTVLGRLDTIALRAWRPQDVHVLDDYSTRIDAWTAAIDTLLDDVHTMELTVACPACATRTVQRDRGGEMVNKAALQINADGCHCLECRTHWAPEYFRHLARVIGCPPPAGILE
jgi:hypothetical protein